MKPELKFGDPESIAVRDAARIEADETHRECKTCGGDGVVYATYFCSEDGCDRGSHEVEDECYCCDGTGEIKR